MICGTRECFSHLNYAFVMDYCSKGNLQSHLIYHHIQSLNVTKKEQWCQQLATALEFIHQWNVVRDLKPETILIDDAENLKIADVGLAKALHDGKVPLSRNTCGQYVEGTALYMAPEVCGGHYTRSSNIFSLGLVIFVICELPDPESMEQTWHH